MRKRQPLKAIAENCKAEDIQLLFGQFLDDFRHADAMEKESLIEEEPEWIDQENGRWSYILAATAETLAHEACIDVPIWAKNKKYISPAPIYGGNTKIEGYRKLLEETSLPEFASRNLYLGDSVLVRY